MYLIRLKLDPRGAQTRRDLANAYDMHRTLSRAFATSDTEPPARFLWRLEVSGKDWAKPQLLVQAQIPGNWESVQSLPNYLQENPEIKQLGLANKFNDNARCRFRLEANPTVTRAGRRYGITAENAQLTWLERQGAKHGFTVDSALVSGEQVLQLRRNGSPPITLQTVRFEGFLRVTDAGALKNALKEGIGPAKAFGCGLLSLAPAQ